MANPLFQSYLRVARAEQRFIDLSEVLEEFEKDIATELLFKAEFYRETLSPDMEKLKAAWPTVSFVPEIALIYSGELVQNLRTALDYLVFLLCARDAGSEQEGTQFLIEDGKGSVAARWGFDFHAPRRLKGMKPKHVDMIENLQPYKGTYWTGRLRDLSNPDKHRHLYEPVLAGPITFRRLPHPSTEDAGLPCRILKAFGPSGEDVYVYIIAPLDVLIESDNSIVLPAKSVFQDLLFKVPQTLELFESCVQGVCGH